MVFAELMSGFGSAFGMDVFGPDENGAYRVDIDGMEVSFSERADPSRVLMRAPVCESPERGSERLYRVMLEAMFIGRATGGAAFSLDPGTGKVFLQRTVTLQTTDLDSFKTVLERFVNILEQWREVVAEFEPIADDLENARQTAATESRRMDSGGFMKV